MAKPGPADSIGKIALDLGDKPFVIESPSGRVFSWQRFVEDRNRLANQLTQWGVQADERILCYGNNSYEWVLTRATATIMRCYFVPLNWHLAAPEVAYIVDNCDASVVIVDSAFASTLQSAKSAEPKLFAKVKHTLVWGGNGSGYDLGIHLNTLLAIGDKAFPQHPPRQLLMSYTGGTSGKPKAVLTDRQTQSKVSKEEQMQEANKIWGPEGLNIICPNMVQIVAAPLYHAAPGGFLGVAMGLAMTLVLMNKFDAKEFLSLIPKYKVTNCVLPPILIKRICDLPAGYVTAYDLSSLTAVMSVGAACPMPVKEAALRIGLPLYEFYGSSELGLNTVLKPKDILRKPGSCGFIAPGVHMKIIGDDGKECPRGTQGLLYVQRSLEYYNADQKTKEAMLASDPTFSTVGDVAYIDEEDFVFICDRKIDMIISGGANIYPAEVEDCLFGHPDIADAAVFGVPDPEYGERVHAALLLKPDRRPSIEDIQAFCRSRIAGFKVPREFSFPEDFPRTPTGKILKRQLREANQKKAKL